MKEYIKNIVDILHKGGVILYPTDTVWGIGCDATNTKAIERVLKIKQVSNAKPLIILADKLDMVAKYTDKVHEVAWELVEVSTRPLTIIYPKAIGLPVILSAQQDESIAIRIVDNQFCKNLIHTLGRPIVSTSANLKGDPTPILFEDISEDIINSVDFVVDSKYSTGMTGQASSIIRVGSKGEIKIIRE